MSVLLVEDEFLIAELLSIMLTDIGLDVCGHAATADDAVTLASRHSPRLVLMDVRLRGAKDGVDAAVEIRRRLAVPIIFITGSGDPATLNRIARHCPAPVLLKPIDFDRLRRTIAETTERPPAAAN